MNFLIRASTNNYGSISPSGDVIVAQGEDKIFTMTPYSGFMIGDILVDGVSVGVISPYTFSAVAATHLIFVRFDGISFDITAFRAAMTEFADTTRYPDSVINFWMGLADLRLSRCRWGVLRNYGLSLFTAHNITLAAQNSANASGMPGTGIGLASSESAGPLSISTDTQITAEPDGGNFNLTVYGQMYLRLARQIGIGGLQV